MNVYLYAILFLSGLSSVHNIAMEETVKKGKKADNRLHWYNFPKKSKRIDGKDSKKNPQNLHEAQKLALAIRIQQQEKKEGK